MWILREKGIFPLVQNVLQRGHLVCPSRLVSSAGMSLSCRTTTRTCSPENNQGTAEGRIIMLKVPLSRPLTLSPYSPSPKHTEGSLHRHLKSPSPASLGTRKAAARPGGEARRNASVLLPGEARPGRDRWTLSRPSSAAALPAEEAAHAHCKRSVLTTSRQRPPKGRALGRVCTWRVCSS